MTDGLAPAFGDTLDLRPDLDQLPALAPEREALWSSLEKTSFLTDNEKRALIGYGPRPPENPAAKANFNPTQPSSATVADDGPAVVTTTVWIRSSSPSKTDDAVAAVSRVAAVQDEGSAATTTTLRDRFQRLPFCHHRRPTRRQTAQAGVTTLRNS